MLFPFIMLGTALFPTINLIYNYSTDDYPEWLDVLARVSIGFYGILNSIVILLLISGIWVQSCNSKTNFDSVQM